MKKKMKNVEPKLKETKENENWVSKFFPPLECDEEIKKLLKEYYKEDFDNLLKFIPTPPIVTTIRVNQIDI
jgi:hypothetical protein